MGSTTPPKNPHDQKCQQLSNQPNSEGSTELNNHELRQRLDQREQEIRQLRLELEKYKIAFKSLVVEKQIDYADRLASTGEIIDDTPESLIVAAASAGNPMSSGVDELDLQTETSLSKEISSQISASGGILFTKTGVGSYEEDEADLGVSTIKSTSIVGSSETKQSSDKINNMASEMQEILQDVEEIDLDLEPSKTRKKRRKPRKEIATGVDQNEIECDANVGMKQHNDNEGRRSNDDNDDNDDEEEDDIITDGLLTSLTDAAINNLSQLAALQERCESQQQHSQPKSLSHERFQTASKRDQSPSGSNIYSSTILPASSASVSTPAVASSATRASGHQSLRRASFNLHDPFSASNLANQAALALSASSGASSLLAHTMNISSSCNPITAGSAIRASSDLNSDQSLASVVAAAAAAAAEAAAVGEHQRHQQTSKHHHLPPNQQLHSQQSRLVTSATTSPDIYQHLQQRQLNLHQISPISSLHFSPSITSPSPSSLIGGPSHQARRSISTASPSILSPIASSGYLRRQYLPDSGGLQMMSPSPTTSLVTMGGSSGIGSAASSAHMLQMAQHHNQQQLHHQHPHSQQRSASALAGPISSQSTSSNAQLGGGSASSAVSPLMTSKNSAQARLNNMQIRHKFGYLGSGRGQFNSPHGFCLGLNQEIVVADTNNHRVCIFDKDGTYITQFGSPGKEEGQLWNPRKVAILHRPIGGSGASSTSGSGSSLAHHRSGPSSASTFSSNFTSGGGIQSTSGVPIGNHFASEPLYVVCDRGAERSRMQLFTKDGAFIKKIGIHYIDIVAGLAITQNGLIIVVDSVSPTVYIINAETGTLNGWFDCSGHMKEPSDIAVKSDIPGNEYFICDFKGHCVVVFSEQGDYLRKIGHDGLTSYPNGIDISDDGDILVGDSHGNRFHVVVFDRNGNFVSQFECPHVKVSRCCGLKITREGYIVTLAKNNHHVLVLDTIHI